MNVVESESQTPSDKEIIRLVLSGAKEAFRPLVLKYQDQVYAMIMRQVGDGHAARDLTQDTFVRAYVSLSSFRFEASFCTWLIQIALNVSRSYFASKLFKDSCKTVNFDASQHGHLHHEQRVHEETSDSADEEALEKLRITIGKLPTKYREVIVLCGLEKKSYLEAAQMLGIPVGTIRSRLNKARHLVRERW